MNILKSSSLQFIFTKYITYGLQFVNALLLAKYLGLYYFGIYSFVTLTLQYLAYSNFGLNNSLNVVLSTEKNKNQQTSYEILSVTLHLTSIIALLLLFGSLGLNYFGYWDIFSKYKFSEYFLIVVFSGILQNFIEIFSNLFRIYGKLNEINLRYLILPVFNFLCLLIFKQEILFWALLINLIISNILIILIFIWKIPFKPFIGFFFSKQIAKVLLKRGVFLLAYNLSFYLIIISARSIVGYYYSVEEFALFNFANSLSTAITMLLGSLSFLFYPKMLNKFSNCDNAKDTVTFIEKVREIYLTLTYLIVYSSLIVSPFIFYIIPEYSNSMTTLKYLLFAQIIISNSFGYSTLLIQKKKESTLTVFGAIAVGIVITSGFIFSDYMHLSYEYIAISVIISVLFYNFFVIYTGNKITGQFNNYLKLIAYIYNYKYLLPIMLFILCSFFTDNITVQSSISLLCYILLNKNEIKTAYKEGLAVLKKNDSLKII